MRAIKFWLLFMPVVVLPIISNAQQNDNYIVKFTPTSYTYFDIIGGDFGITPSSMGHWLKFITRKPTSHFGIGTSLMSGYNFSEKKAMCLMLPIDLYWTLHTTPPYRVRSIGTIGVTYLYFSFTFWGKTLQWRDPSYEDRSIGFGSDSHFDIGIEWHPSLGVSFRAGNLWNPSNEYTIPYITLQLHLGGWLVTGETEEYKILTPLPKVSQMRQELMRAPEDTIPKALSEVLPRIQEDTTSKVSVDTFQMTLIL